MYFALAAFRALSRHALLLLGCTFAAAAFAQNAPSHDPSRMIRNTDGRYWIFTTGNGIWTMSSSNSNFTDWRAENPVFPNGYPSWINNYVTGFTGSFWAPDVIKSGSTYYCYYSCAGQGAPAAIGLATATNLAGPWTDRGLIVAGNNAIDPAPIIDGSNWYMAYGNWQTGIDIIQLNPSTGLRQGSTLWRVIPNQQVEAPYLLKNGSYYYLFFQRGLCCNGTSSTYYTQVGRSTSIGGPYVDRNGVALTSNGGTTFLPNRDGRFIGPGHVGYGEGKLTYHFYDGQDNGNAKLRITTLSWSNGWPVADGVNLGGGGGGGGTQTIANGTYSLRNRASGKMLDNLGSTADGANVAQWADGSSYNQRWEVTYSGGYYKLRCLTGSKYLDSMGRTTDGSQVGQWANSSSTNQQWTIESVGSGYYRVVNRANGKALDTGGGTADGAVMQMWFTNSSNNQQWQFVAP